MLDFSDSEINMLRKCFNSLDSDGGGSIGLEELEVRTNLNKFMILGTVNWPRLRRKQRRSEKHH
jgi:hypothetical protein